MRPADFLLLLACCIAWGLNLPLTRWLVADVPPIFLAGLRFLGLALLLSPFLRPFPRQFGLVFAIAMCIGGVHFALLFLGLQAAPASAVAIVGQIGLPIVTILSIIFLQEKVRWRRTLGMSLAFAGVIAILYQPGKFSFELGLLYVVASAFIGAAGSILMKRLEPIPALNLQAWVGLLSFAPLFALSAFLEQGQIHALIHAPMHVWVGIVFSVVVVSIFGHSAYYQLVKKYDITLLAPLTLMTPVIAVATGVVFLHEPVTLKLLIGGGLTLAGVFLVAARENKSLPNDAVAQAKTG
ncbi:putative amino-acid metabolite efflux pump [Candidatus Phycosocius bacilliformis]|uniref:Putative amino-acid metabolite efflux pump n=1 Tax=Candidatus Phycosocius bacilliformis TaxID=1445552 RepID=A0A2P2E7Y2_9PROT|nr:DMT family transporter [Candidatus Phycosocius bacilliformis]GBF57147.1 putative amino-acid metabolite efflux pump [Candidatus Phycosocius bacilliformis]